MLTGIFGRMLTTFSIMVTVPNLMSAKAPKGSLSCLNGLRFLATMFIVFGHTWNLGANGPNVPGNSLLFPVYIGFCLFQFRRIRTFRDSYLFQKYGLKKNSFLNFKLHFKHDILSFDKLYHPYYYKKKHFLGKKLVGYPSIISCTYRISIFRAWPH